MPWQPPAVEDNGSNNEDGFTAADQHVHHAAKKKLLEDLASRRLATHDGTPSVKDERRCNFEIVTVPLRQKKVEAKPVVVAEEPETDDLSGHLDAWENSWQGDLKLHKKRIMHEIWTDPRDPAMGRMLAIQNITQIHGQKLMEKIHKAMDAIGDALFVSMRATYVKTYQNGMFTTDQTITRLLSSFKIEVRTVLTADAVRQKVLLECMEELFGSSEQHMGAGMTLHRFKLEAMDHYLEAHRAHGNHPSQPSSRSATAPPLHASPHVTMSRAAKERRFQILCDQVEDYQWTTQSHMLTYCGMNSSDSLAHLRKILLLLCRLPSLELVPLPFKAEMAKATTLVHLRPGDAIASADVVSPHMYMVLNGRVDMATGGEGSSPIQKDAETDWIVGGDMDVLLSRPGGVDLTASSADVAVAILPKADVEAILRQSFHPTSLLDKHGKFKSVPHHQRLAVKPKPPPSTGGVHRPRSIAQIVKITTALPRHQRDRIKRTKCTESRMFSEAYIKTQREAKHAATEATDDDAACHEHEKPNRIDADDANDVGEHDQGYPSPHRNSSVTSIVPRKLSSLSLSRPKAVPSISSPAFEFFPTFSDRFDPTQLDVLFLPSIPFPMDEMRLTDIGPPCPDAPSFVMPPRVQIDMAVLLLDQLQLLCKTQAPSATVTRDKRRQSVDSQASMSTVMQHQAPLVFHVHDDSNADESSLVSLAPLTLQQFIDGRKTVTAAAVKGQKVPFASVSLYCVDWNQPMCDVAEEPVAKENGVPDDDAWLSVVNAAMGNQEAVPANDSIAPSRTRPAESELSGSLRRKSRRLSVAQDTIDNAGDVDGKNTRRKQSAGTSGGRRRRSSSTHGGDSERDNDDLELSDSVSELAPSRAVHDGSTLSPQRSFITEFDDIPPDTPRDGTADNTDTKHLFNIESKRQTKQTTVSRRRMLASTEPSRVQSQSRREVYKKVICQVSTLDAPVETDPTLHLKQLEIEQKLQDEIGKAMLEDGKPCPWRINLQQRMEAVLSALQLSARKKLAVVMKYTSLKHSANLEAALDLWEKAANCIMDRETTLQRVYEFELVASDPRRLFQTISTLRLKVCDLAGISTLL
ncbi:hypothetical protein, variant [Aphanomyces invadans]|uniref:Cyclic nucleotide-binding domain-containing protein n=1 Tax=Aphanomyces invadans TaxID=157072 RepID=A0A024T986_9STRA|nr:hypothetical protein, variant [Aphanomyces invadans]ETV90715.1 hypothetical protein, variant [Aphanomyces invadans]|eukprot:XP_008880655.1 hypothetical protein, variant [Aphanomyces invadans]